MSIFIKTPHFLFFPPFLFPGPYQSSCQCLWSCAMVTAAPEWKVPNGFLPRHKLQAGFNTDRLFKNPTIIKKKKKTLCLTAMTHTDIQWPHAVITVRLFCQMTAGALLIPSWHCVSSPTAHKTWPLWGQDFVCVLIFNQLSSAVFGRQHNGASVCGAKMLAMCSLLLVLQITLFFSSASLMHPELHLNFKVLCI